MLFILLQCMTNKQTFVLITSHTKLKIQINVCKSYAVKNLLNHCTFAQLLCRYNFEIKISCKHVHTHTQQAYTGHVHLTVGSRLFFKRDGTHAETSFCLSPKRTSPFKSVGATVQSTSGSRGVRISISNAGYTTLWGSVRVLVTHSIRQFPLHFPSRASPCVIRFQTRYIYRKNMVCL
jgi:hypothetical protein